MTPRPQANPEAHDPSEPLRVRASEYPGVDEGTACTQSSFKAGKKSFFFVGMQGGRHKAMFKLGPSRAEAERLAKKQPADYQVGNSGWVTARFSESQPLPKRLWQKWLDESYELTVAPPPKNSKITKKSKSTKKKSKVAKKAAQKKASAKKRTSSKKSASKKSTSKKKSTKKSAAAQRRTGPGKRAAGKKVTKKKSRKKSSTKKTTKKKARS